MTQRTDCIWFPCTAQDIWNQECGRSSQVIAGQVRTRLVMVNIRETVQSMFHSAGSSRKSIKAKRPVPFLLQRGYLWDVDERLFSAPMTDRVVAYLEASEHTSLGESGGRGATTD